MNKFGLIAVSVLLMGLSACGSLGTVDGPLYQDAEAVKLKSVDDLVLPPIDPRFEIKETRVGATQQEVNNALPTFSGLALQREGAAVWLYADATADALWPQLRNFWKAQGLTVISEEPAIGLMETDWAEDRSKLPNTFIDRWLEGISDSGLRDRYRLRVETDKTTGVNIFITHRGSQQVVEQEDVVRWLPAPNQPDLEAEMLQRLRLFLGGGESQPGEVAIVETENTAELLKIKSGQFEQHPALLVTENYDRVWRLLGVTLDRVGLVVEERHPREGIYVVTNRMSSSEKKQQSFWDSLFGEPLNSLLYEEQYQLHINDQGSSRSLVITAHDNDGLFLEEAQAKDILNPVLAALS